MTAQEFKKEVYTCSVILSVVVLWAVADDKFPGWVSVPAAILLVGVYFWRHWGAGAP